MLNRTNIANKIHKDFQNKVLVPIHQTKPNRAKNYFFFSKNGFLEFLLIYYIYLNGILLKICGAIKLRLVYLKPTLKLFW